MKISGLALKAKIQYSTWDKSNWHCYYHALSGDELKNQIISIFYKPTKDQRSWTYENLSSLFKEYEEFGIKKWLKETYAASDNDIDECVNYILTFFNDAREEFNMKPLTYKTT